MINLQIMKFLDSLHLFPWLCELLELSNEAGLTLSSLYPLYNKAMTGDEVRVSFVINALAVCLFSQPLHSSCTSVPLLGLMIVGADAMDSDF